MRQMVEQNFELPPESVIFGASEAMKIDEPVVEDSFVRDEFGSWLLWPNWCLEVYPGGNLTVFHHVPVTPELTVQKVEWYFPPHPLTSLASIPIDPCPVCDRPHTYQ